MYACRRWLGMVVRRAADGHMIFLRVSRNRGSGLDHGEFNIYRYTWTLVVLSLIRSRKDLMRVFVHHHDCDTKISVIEGFMRWAKTVQL